MRTMTTHHLIEEESRRIAAAVEYYMDAKMEKTDLETVVITSLAEAILQGRLQGQQDMQPSPSNPTPTPCV